MGRKIPAKKHRGVKDPLVQQAKRIASLKDKINAAPKDPDEQPVPKSLMRLFAFQEPDNKKKNVTKKMNKNHSERHQTQSKDGSSNGAVNNPISRLHRLPGESGRGFSLRINSAVKALHNPAEELHYPLDIEAEDEKGWRMSEQRERRARKRRKAARAAQAQDQDVEPRLSRTQKLALKKKAKKMKTSEPGKRDLLLTSLLAGGAAHNKKLAPPAERERHERARLAAVAAYRALKASNIKKK